MYNQLRSWADHYEPISRDEELQVIAKYRDDDRKLLEVLLQHNARYLVKYISKWQSTYDLDDASSIAILAITRKFHEWDHKSSFVYFVKYIIMSSLHRTIPKVFEELEDYDAIDETCKPYNDDCEALLSDLQALLSKPEYDFIVDIYFNNKTVKVAGDKYGLHSDPSKSRKHSQILAKIKRHLTADKNIKGGL